MVHSYPSDVSREQFNKIKPILESVRKKTRPRKIDLYDVFCGILYVLKSGCQWRMLPKEYPQWELCYYYFSLWKQEEGPGSGSVLEKVLKKNSWRGPTKQWSERENQFHNSGCTKR
jgi:transposase